MMFYETSNDNVRDHSKTSSNIRMLDNHPDNEIVSDEEKDSTQSGTWPVFHLTNIKETVQN